MSLDSIKIKEFFSTENAKINALFCVILACDLALLAWVASTLSIDIFEADEFFYGKSLGANLARFGVWLFGQNDFGLRILFLCTHALCVWLLFTLCKNILKTKKDALICACIFMAMPGVCAQSVQLSSGSLNLCLVLALCLAILRAEFWEQNAQNLAQIQCKNAEFNIESIESKNTQKSENKKIDSIESNLKKSRFFWLLALIFGIIGGLFSTAFGLVFLGILFYAIKNKNSRLLWSSLALFSLNAYIFGLGISGHPSGHFLDANAHLALIFSPIFYIFLIFSIVRFFSPNLAKNSTSLPQKKPLLWYIVLVCFIFILLLSLRQRVDMREFAPLLLLAVPLVCAVFLNSFRVRLRCFRARYYAAFVVFLIFLLPILAAFIFAKPLFLVLDNPQKHFGYRHFVAKELANKLKKEGIFALKTNEDLALRLKFYGIKEAKSPILWQKNLDSIKSIESTKAAKSRQEREISVFYKNALLGSFYLKE